ncbi:MAG: malonyl-ACP O-methyltransferase BioC [Steroidobacteraceae bacterium]
MLLERQAIARRFGKAAPAYADHAQLQLSVAKELHARLRSFALKPARMLDLGAGTGNVAQFLRDDYRRAEIVALDLAPAMLAQLRTRWPRRRIARVCADAEHLPFADHSFDVVQSNLMLQWCLPPQNVMNEVARVLRPDGLFLFSTFGPETLGELATSWAAVDDGLHVHAFPDMADLAAMLSAAGFVEPVLDCDRLRRDVPSVAVLLGELRGLGAGNALAQRRRSLTGARRYAAMVKHYEALRQGDGRLPVSWQVIYGAAFAGPPRTLAGETRIDASRITRRRREGR